MLPAGQEKVLCSTTTSVDALAAVNTAGMSRQELVAHNKNLKVTITIFSNSFINLMISKFSRERGNHTLGITHS